MVVLPESGRHFGGHLWERGIIVEKQTQRDNGNDDVLAHQLLDLGRISEIARRALKRLIGLGKPAIPPYYEKAFYREASEMGEGELLNELSTSLPPGQALNIMVEGVSSMITTLNADIGHYREDLTQHGGQLDDKHVHMKELVDPRVWKVVEEDFTELRAANLRMKQQLEAAQDRLHDQEKEVHTLQRKSRSDGLTGVLNRLAMEEDLADEFARAKRYGRRFAIVMADIDHFKQVNDTYGHGVGDEALKAFAGILRHGLREVDVTYRYGGEEFLILLPETDRDGALIAAERLRARVQSQVLTHRNDASVRLRLTASFGIAAFRDDDAHYHAVMERADSCLYLAKANGRNRVECS